MKILVDKNTKKQVKVGDVVKDDTIKRIVEPSTMKPTGMVWVSAPESTIQREYYPIVFGLEFVEESEVQP